jgi:hypothetical protein
MCFVDLTNRLREGKQMAIFRRTTSFETSANELESADAIKVENNEPDIC